MPSIRFLVMLVVALPLLLAACGGSSTPTSIPSPTPTPTPTPVPSGTSDGPFSQAKLEATLSLADVLSALPSLEPASAEFVDFRAMAANVNPAQVVGMEFFQGFSIEATDRSGGVTFTVIDFESRELVESHIATAKEGGQWSVPEPAIADESFFAEGGGVAVVVFWKGDLAVTLSGSGSAADLDAILELARLVDSRL